MTSLPQARPASSLIGGACLAIVYAASVLGQTAAQGPDFGTELKLARENLRAGKYPEAQADFLKALAVEPRDFDANREMATLLLAQNNVVEARPYLRTAHLVRPEDGSTTYNLALADVLTGDLREGRTLVQALLATSQTADAHNLLGQIEEQEGRFVPAAREFETAARLDPSEDNLYAWGGEMLKHRTFEPAVTIFHDATQRYPQSPRLWVGLGMALYSRELYTESVQALLRAAALDPHDPRCYLFLDKAYLSAPSQAAGVLEAFSIYATLEPRNARAQFYYGTAMWKAHRTESTVVDYPAVEALLSQSIHLDENFAEAHLQLGILYNEERAYEKSLSEYQRALQLDPSLAEAHFRLGRYYLRIGEREKGQAELDRFKSLQAAHQAQVDKQRAEVQQFVVSAGTRSAAQNP